MSPNHTLRSLENVKKVNCFLQTKLLRLCWRFETWLNVYWLIASYSLWPCIPYWFHNSVETNVVWWIIVSDTLTFSISVIFGSKYFQNFWNYLTPYAKKIFEFFFLIIRTYWLEDMNWSESGRATKRACSFILNANIVLSSILLSDMLCLSQSEISFRNPLRNWNKKPPPY